MTKDEAVATVSRPFPAPETGKIVVKVIIYDV